MKICVDCGESKSLEDFATRSAKCRPCHNIYTRQHYKDNRQYYIDKATKRNNQEKLENRLKILQYLLLHPCVDCGNTDPEVIDFDHRDPTLKSANVSRLLTGSWAVLEAEIAKCDVRCRNCHIKKTRRQFGHWTVDDYPDVYPLATNQSKG